MSASADLTAYRHIAAAAKALADWHEKGNPLGVENALLALEYEIRALRGARDTLTGSSDERSENG